MTKDEIRTLVTGERVLAKVTFGATHAYPGVIVGVNHDNQDNQDAPFTRIIVRFDQPAPVNQKIYAGPEIAMMVKWVRV